MKRLNIKSSVNQMRSLSVAKNGNLEKVCNAGVTPKNGNLNKICNAGGANSRKMVSAIRFTNQWSN